MISITERLLSGKLQNDFDNNGIQLTVEQWRILFYLWKSDGINQQELADISNKEKSTITRQIEALEKKGLLARNNSSRDKRNKLIFLTEQGKALEERTLRISDGIIKKAEDGISSDELIIFKAVLRKMMKNLGSLHISNEDVEKSLP